MSIQVELNTTHIPGFTAEASTYRTPRSYSYTVEWAGSADSQAGLSRVRPAAGECPVIRIGCHFDSELGGCFSYIQRADCSEKYTPCICPPPPVTCGPCVGTRKCSDGSTRTC